MRLGEEGLPHAGAARFAGDKGKAALHRRSARAQDPHIPAAMAGEHHLLRRIVLPTWRIELPIELALD